MAGQEDGSTNVVARVHEPMSGTASHGDANKLPNRLTFDEGAKGPFVFWESDEALRPLR